VTHYKACVCQALSAPGLPPLTSLLQVYCGFTFYITATRKISEILKAGSIEAFMDLDECHSQRFPPSIADGDKPWQCDTGLRMGFWWSLRWKGIGIGNGTTSMSMGRVGGETVGGEGANSM
jgi:hypothetical protein